jgi:phage-related baseplate assembly protein
MADLQFIKTNAKEIYDTIITELENGVNEPLFPGDERRIFGEALVPLFVAMHNAVNDAAKQKMLRYARGTVLNALAENRGIEREDAVVARTVMRFSVDEPLSENIIIPAGTRVTGDFVRYFETAQTASLTAGVLYVDIPTVSVEGGNNYNNISTGEIHTLVDLSNAPLIDDVMNIEVTAGGADEETDDSLRDRIRNVPNAASTAGPASAYRYWAMAADPLIADASTESPEPGVVLVTPICYGGEVPGEDLLAKVLASVSHAQRRPLTDKVLVQAPSVKEFDIELTYYTTSANVSRVIETVEGNGGAIDQYKIWQSSNIGNNINPDQLRRRILAPDWESGLFGADRVDIVKPAFEELDSSTVAKFSGNIQVNHVVM